jgi:5-oxoprolinase (ATP-hydrolysing) subunit A
MQRHQSASDGMTIDLNCDLGELDNAAHEVTLLDNITSANIACGGHAGDEGTMERSVRLALERGVRIGAHPGYPDREHFGRVELPLPPAEIVTTVRLQIAALEAVVQRCGGAIVHVKPHGALYNAAARDETVARAIGTAVLQWNPAARLFGLAGSRALDVWREMGLVAIAEGFADRAYAPDGSLRPRKLPGALIADPAAAAAQALALARSGRVQTICVHGDSPGAVAILRACRETLSR